MRVKLIIATHGRHGILWRMVEHLEETVEAFASVGVQLIPVFGGDEADRKICDGYEFHTLENDPLGAKLNALLDCGTDEYDYMMQLGSDDFLTSEGALILAGWMHQGAPFFGMRKLYVTRFSDGETKVCEYKSMMGAGRCIAKRLLDDTKRAKGYVWSPPRQRGMDGSSEVNIVQSTNVYPKVVTSYDPLIWDVKDETNLNKYDQMLRGKVVTLPIEKIPNALKGVVKHV